jgi:hypothetical protein
MRTGRADRRAITRSWKSLGNLAVIKFKPPILKPESFPSSEVIAISFDKVIARHVACFSSQVFSFADRNTRKPECTVRRINHVVLGFDVLGSGIGGSCFGIWWDCRCCRWNREDSVLCLSGAVCRESLLRWIPSTGALANAWREGLGEYV